MIQPGAGIKFIIEPRSSRGRSRGRSRGAPRPAAARRGRVATTRPRHRARACGCDRFFTHGRCT